MGSEEEDPATIFEEEDPATMPGEDPATMSEEEYPATLAQEEGPVTVTDEEVPVAMSVEEVSVAMTTEETHYTVFPEENAPDITAEELAQVTLPVEEAQLDLLNNSPQNSADAEAVYNESNAEVEVSDYEIQGGDDEIGADDDGAEEGDDEGEFWDEAYDETYDDEDNFDSREVGAAAYQDIDQVGGTTHSSNQESGDVGSDTDDDGDEEWITLDTAQNILAVTDDTNERDLIQNENETGTNNQVDEESGYDQRSPNIESESNRSSGTESTSSSDDSSTDSESDSSGNESEESEDEEIKPETNSNETFEGSQDILDHTRIDANKFENIFSTDENSEDLLDSFYSGKEMIGLKNEDALSDSFEDQHNLDDSEYFLDYECFDVSTEIAASNLEGELNYSNEESQLGKDCSFDDALSDSDDDFDSKIDGELDYSHEESQLDSTGLHLTVTDEFKSKVCSFDGALSDSDDDFELEK